MILADTRRCVGYRRGREMQAYTYHGPLPAEPPEADFDGRIVVDLAALLALNEDERASWDEVVGWAEEAARAYGNGLGSAVVTSHKWTLGVAEGRAVLYGSPDGWDEAEDDGDPDGAYEREGDR